MLKRTSLYPQFGLGILLILISLVLPRLAGAASSGLDPNDYPAIGDKEMGQLKWALKIADQDLLDFSNLEASEQEFLTSYRYNLGFMTYFLALEQYHKLPACPEIIEPRMDRLIQKMISKPVWDYWAVTSKGLRVLEPYLNRPYPSERDPIGKKNIMYSGHLGHMIGLYEMLYRNYKWDEPGAIVFKWSDEEKYVYDNHSLQKVMYDQMVNHPDNCIECEPNACYPECNQHPILSFMLYDYLHKTNLAKARDLFMNFFLRTRQIDPNNHETAAMYLVKQKVTVSQSEPRLGSPLSLGLAPGVHLGLFNITSSALNGWNGTMMHAWQPELIERHYPYQLKNHLIEMDEERARVNRDILYDNLSQSFFALLASEVGDAATVNRIINWCDRKYKPIMDDNGLRYPIYYANTITPVNYGHLLTRKPINLTAHLIACARANVKNGFWTMHNQPFDEEHFSEPVVKGVDFPNLMLRRAIFDRKRQALVVSTAGNAKKEGVSSFKAANLNPNKSWRYELDGKAVATYQGKDSITMEVALDRPHDIVLIAE